MSDEDDEEPTELQVLWVRCEHLEALNAELVTSLEGLLAQHDSGSIPMPHQWDFARAAIAKARG